MGLDMYLYAERHVGGWKHARQEERDRFEAILEAARLSEVVDDGSPHVEVRACVGYWRKANQIHKWLVEHVQGGVDDCRYAYVEPDELRTLRETCMRVLASTTLVDGEVYAGTTYSAKHPKGAVQMVAGKVLQDPALAHELLPAQEGFFFGGNDYDQWYWEAVEHTVEVIDRAFAIEGVSFYYHASW